MEGHRVYVGIGPNLPALVVIQMHVARDGFRVWRRGIEGMSQNPAGPVERKRITVSSTRKQDVHGSKRLRVGPAYEVYLRNVRPLIEGSEDFRLRRGRREFFGHLREYVVEHQPTGP